MRLSTFFMRAAMQAAGLAILCLPAQAIDLNGAWSTGVGSCDKMFAKKGKAISFQRNSELYGSGFIIDGNQIRGPSAKCAIKSRKEDGANVHLVASCATDLMLSSVQFSVKVVDDNKISRIFPGMEGMEISYERCP